MWEWLVPVIIVVGVILLVGIYLWASSRSFAQLRTRVDESWAAIDALLSERADLVPTLIGVVSERASHEKAVLENATRAREELLAAGGPQAAGTAEGHLQQALRRVLQMAEAYPQLQSREDFLTVTQEIARTGDRVQAARRAYNGEVRELNTRMRVFPTNLFARGMTEREFFDAADGIAVSEAPRVQF